MDEPDESEEDMADDVAAAEDVGDARWDVVNEAEDAPTRRS